MKTSGETVDKIMGLIEKNNEITILEMSKSTGVSTRSVQREFIN